MWHRFLGLEIFFDEIDSLWSLEELPPDAVDFFEATKRGTTDIKARLVRHKYIVNKLKSL